MGIRYECKLMINVTKDMKEKANKKAFEKDQDLSTYIRDLISKDLKNNK